MDERERQELALDIARRVRLLCVQEAPQALLDMLMPSGRQMHVLYTRAASDRLCVEYEVSSDGAALHILVRTYDAILARIRLDAPSPVLAELQRST